jgi:hypothetical protein
LKTLIFGIFTKENFKPSLNYLHQNRYYCSITTEKRKLKERTEKFFRGINFKKLLFLSGIISIKIGLTCQLSLYKRKGK